MKISFALLIVIRALYSLSYVESSGGLQTPVMESGRTELEMVDVDLDGHVDIVSIGDHGSPYVNTQEHGIMVWFGNGAGSWSVYQSGEFGYGGIAIADVNNDGFMDAGYGMHHNWSDTDFGDSILEVALGDGTGRNWTPWDDGISIGDPDSWGMFSTDLGDIDNDGDLDLGSISFGADDGVHVFRNNRDGTWTRTFGWLGGNSQMEFDFGDVDADGRADFCVAHQYGSIYLGNGAGSFTLADGNLPAPGTTGRRGPCLGDVDNDGDQDLSFCTSGGGIQVWAWQGSNTWANVSGSLPSSGPYDATQLWDMDLDGSMDVCAFGDSTVSVWLGNGAGVWTLDTTFKTHYPGYWAAFRVGGDGDHNGYPDIALVSREGSGYNPVNHPRFFKETSIPESLFIKAVFPRGAEAFYSGSVAFVRWACGVPTGQTATVKLELSLSGAGGPWTQVAAGLPNNGRYQWPIPTGISSNNCYIRYTASTVSDTATGLTPAAFRILPGLSVREAGPAAAGHHALDCPGLIAGSAVRFLLRTPGPGQAFLNIYDCLGRRVRSLFRAWGEIRMAVTWDRTDGHGVRAAPGVYCAVLEGENFRISRKLILLDP